MMKQPEVKMKLRNVLYGLLIGFGVATSLIAMDGNTGTQVTYGCDWCQEQKPILNNVGPDTDYHGVSCQHVLCKECTKLVSEKYAAIPKDPRFYWCNLCRAFYEEKHKVCWFTTNSIFSASSSGIRAQSFINLYGGTARQLPDIDVNTVIPINPNNPQGQQQRQYTCQHCHIRPEKIVKVTRQLSATGYCQSKGTVGYGTKLSDAYYCEAHENTMPATNTIEEFKQKCQELYPRAQWAKPFPQYVTPKETVDNPVVVHDDHTANFKYPVSKYVPLGIIGLIAVGAIYYYWSSDKKEKDDQDDEQEQEAIQKHDVNINDGEPV
jgi:hypothetical protein